MILKGLKFHFRKVLLIHKYLKTIKTIQCFNKYDHINTKTKTIFSNKSI